MKTQKWMKLAFLALSFGFILYSCTKEDVFIADIDKSAEYTVRPDFATLDTRPADVIAEHMITETVPAKLDPNAEKGGKYALVIGISNYAGTANDLQYCDDDAQDWKTRLQAEGYTVNIITDLSATKANIEAAVTTLASQSVAGNEIAFIYSGHGSKGNIVTTDLYYISYTWFTTKFSSATSTKMFFSFDACQIGYMVSLAKEGRIVAMASSKTTYSYDGNASTQNGVFTYYQMMGFDQMGYIYVEPDCDYAITQNLAWAKVNKVRVAPSYKDMFTGFLDL